MVTKLGVRTTVGQACEDFEDEWLVVKILPHERDPNLSPMDVPIQVISRHTSKDEAHLKLRKVVAVNEDKSVSFKVMEAVGYITTGEELKQAIDRLMTDPHAWEEYERRRRYLWV